MKRLLRKKRRFGEYAEYGFFVIGTGPEMTDAEQNKLCDDLIGFAQAMNVGVSGAIGSKVEFFASRLCMRRRCMNCNRRFGRDRRFTPVSDVDRVAFVSWLAQRGVVAFAGPLIDAWHSTEAEFDAAEPKL